MDLQGLDASVFEDMRIRLLNCIRYGYLSYEELMETRHILSSTADGVRRETEISQTEAPN
jgi:hypothetical protein